MLRNNLGNSSESKNEDGSVSSQTEHNIVATYLIMADEELSNLLNTHIYQVLHTGIFVPEPSHLITWVSFIQADRMISILSNMIVLGIFIKYKELRTCTNALIVNLAVTDIGVSSIGYPMSAASDLNGSWKFGYAGCQIYAALNIFFGMASIGLLTAVAMDRYLTFCRSHTGRRMTTNTYISMILGAWTNGLFWALMPLTGWASYAPDPTGATCTINWRKNDGSFVSFTMTVVAVNFIAPLTVMFYCYYHVSRSVKGHTASNCTEDLERDWSDQVDVTKMSVIMILMFLVAWSPYSIVCFWASFGDPKKIPPSVAITAPLFAKSSTFYNPCIYVVANKKFRKAMFAMLKCQTHQATPVTSVLPMDVSQNPLASGRN